MLQSSILNFGLSRGSPIGGPDNGFVLDLPTEAATAWYHYALPHAPASLDALLPKVQQFALGEYSDALSRGSTLDAATFNDVVAKLHQYTGLSDAYIRNSNLRIPYPRFQAELFGISRRSSAGWNSRFTMETLNGLADRADDDPTEAAINGPFTAAVNDYLRGALGYKTPFLYRSNAYDIIQQSGGWKNEHDGNAVIDVTPELAGAMTFDPHLQILFGQRLLRFRDAVLRHRVYPQSLRNRTELAAQYHVRKSHRPHDLFGAVGVDATARRSGTLVCIRAGEPANVMSRKILGASLAAIALLGVVRHTPKTTDANAPVSVPPGYVIPDAVTRHSLLLDGKRITYAARAGTIVLRDDDNHPTATMFYTAYTRDGVDSVKRPVTFFYNGGPGSSTIWLRMGSFGQCALLRVITAPSRGRHHTTWSITRIRCSTPAISFSSTCRPAATAVFCRAPTQRIFSEPTTTSARSRISSRATLRDSTAGTRPKCCTASRTARRARRCWSIRSKPMASA